MSRTAVEGEAATRRRTVGGRAAIAIAFLGVAVALPSQPVAVPFFLGIACAATWYGYRSAPNLGIRAPQNLATDSRVFTLFAFGCAASLLNGVRVGNTVLTVFDALLGLAFLAVLVSTRRQHLRMWMRWRLVRWWSVQVSVLIGSMLLAYIVVAASRAPDAAWLGLLLGLQFAATVLVVPLLVAGIVNTPQRLAVVIHAMVLSGLLNASVALLDATGVLEFGWVRTAKAYSGREIGLTTHPNHLGLVSALALVLTIAAFASARGRVLRAVFIVVGMTLTGGILVSGSRAGIAAAAIGVGGYFIYRRQWWRLIVLVALALVALPFATDALKGLSQDDSAGTRPLIALERLLHADRTVIGSNAARIERLSETLDRVDDTLFIGSGFDQLRFAHNIYLQLAASGGAIALGGFSLIVGALTRWALWTRNRAGAGHDRTGDPFAAASFACVLAWLATGFVQNILVDRYLYLFVGLLIAAHRVDRVIRDSPAHRKVRRATS